MHNYYAYCGFIFALSVGDGEVSVRNMFLASQMYEYPLDGILWFGAKGKVGIVYVMMSVSKTFFLSGRYNKLDTYCTNQDIFLIVRL